MCTVAAIVLMLGAMPPRGTVIEIPRSQINSYSPHAQEKAKKCAAKYGIKWRIDESK